MVGVSSGKTKVILNFAKVKVEVVVYVECGKNSKLACQTCL